MSEQHTNETAQDTMNKYETDTDTDDTDAGDTWTSTDPAISPAPDPDFANTDDNSAVNQVSREV